MLANLTGSTVDKPALTRKEQDLLKLLENNPGRCYSRSYLLKTIWGTATIRARGPSTFMSVGFAKNCATAATS